MPPSQVYGIDTDAVALRAKQEFATKDKGRRAPKPAPKPPAKPWTKLLRPLHNSQPKETASISAIRSMIETAFMASAVNQLMEESAVLVAGRINAYYRRMI
jgi:hypothetical protein